MMKQFTKIILLYACFCNSAFAQLGWYVVPNAPVAPRFEDVSFVGNTGWVAENYNATSGGVVIHKTTDGGNTWTITDTITPDTYFARSVEFINDSIGFVGMLENGGAAGVMRTTDGGTAFLSVISPAFANNAGVCGMAHYGNTVIGVGIFSGQQNFYKSTDAGLTWSLSVLDTLVEGLVDCYMFNDSVYIISGQATAAQNNKACILKSNDGGTTWQMKIMSSHNSSWCWKLNFLPGGKGCGSIQVAQTIFLTTDSGNTWTEQLIGSCFGPAEDFGGTAFLNDTLGWVANQFFNHCFYETKDGGASWASYTFGEAIDRMVVLDSQNVVAVGATIYKYNMDSVTSVNNPAPVIKRNLLKLIPNPANTELYIEADLKFNTLAHISILNTDRQLVKKVFSGNLRAGGYFFNVNTKSLPQGNYIVYLVTYLEHASEKFQVIH